MNLPNFTLFLAALLLLPSPSFATSLNLYQVQKITSFPPKCMATYTLDITDCTPTEITVTGKITPQGRGICSSQCIAALSTISRNLNAACAGLQASPDTLIGLFFSDKGVSYLCPNSVQGTGPAPSSTSKDSSATSSSASSLSSSSALASTETSSITTVSSTSTSSSSSESRSAATTAKPTPSFEPTTAVSNGVATVLSSEAQRTASSNPDAFGGGGSPFEVAENAAISGRVGNGSSAVVYAVMSLAVLVGCSIVVGG